MSEGTASEMSSHDSPPASDEPRHPIQVVSRRTGLTPDVIRAWERRYRAVKPQRSPKNRRLYSDADVERLQLLRRATSAGRRIGDVFRLAADELRALVEEDERAVQRVRPAAAAATRSERVEDHYAACMEAVEKLDSERLEQMLATAAVVLTPPALIDDLVVPLMEEVGSRWRSGTMRPVHEHMTTATVRSFLASVMENAPGRGSSTADLIVTTPSGQIHELGALMAAVTSALDDWRVTYLGPSLPAEEIAAAVRQRDARAVALSVIYPADDPRLSNELRKLRRLLPERVRIYVGGSAAKAYDDVLAEIGASRVERYGRLRDELEALRSGSA